MDPNVLFLEIYFYILNYFLKGIHIVVICQDINKNCVNKRQ